MAGIPKNEFERLIESDDFSHDKLYYLARLRANKSATYERECPHCGGLLLVEGEASLKAALDLLDAKLAPEGK